MNSELALAKLISSYWTELERLRNKIRKGFLKPSTKPNNKLRKAFGKIYVIAGSEHIDDVRKLLNLPLGYWV